MKRKGLAVTLALLLAASLLAGCGAAAEKASDAKADTETKTESPDSENKADAEKADESEEKKEETAEVKETAEPAADTAANIDKTSENAASSGTDTKAAANAASSANTSAAKDAAPAPQSVQKKECDHNWVAQTQIIHHDEVRHAVPLTFEYAIDLDKSDGCESLCVLEQKTFSGDEENEISAWEDSVRAKYPDVTLVFNDTYGMNVVVDQEAYDETVPDGYKCSKCGATKQ